jgi:uncharacterized membrane protein YebE (DUF533 family)
MTDPVGQVIQIASQFGAIAILVGIGWFVAFKVWPEWTQNERPWQRTNREKQQEREFMADQQMSEALESMARALTGQAEATAMLAAEVRRVHERVAANGAGG